MNIHEYQAKQLLAQYGVAVPGGEPCKSPEQARAVAEKLFADYIDVPVLLGCGRDDLPLHLRLT